MNTTNGPANVLERYALYRNVVISIILTILVSYSLFTVDLEISTIDNKEFIRCGLSFCKRFEISGFFHHKFSSMIAAVLIGFNILPMTLFVFEQMNASIISIIFSPIVWLLVLIRGDIISMDHYLMGIDTHVTHGPARNIIMGVSFLLSVYGVLETIGLHYIRRMMAEKKIEQDNAIKQV